VLETERKKWIAIGGKNSILSIPQIARMLSAACRLYAYNENRIITSATEMKKAGEGDDSNGT
jgi:hypothetical protein